MTLLTCTSYQINSQRLRVRGKRVFDAPITPQTEEAEPLPIKGLILSFVTLEAVAVLIWYIKIRYNSGITKNESYRRGRNGIEL